MSRFFGRPKPDKEETQHLEATKQVIENQRQVSDETLKLVREVLARKDELLAEAINQTGQAVRHPRRVSKARAR